MARSKIRPAVLAALLTACIAGGGIGASVEAQTLDPAFETVDPSLLIPRIAAALGRPLTPDEQVRCLDAGRRVIAASREQQLVFVHEVADLFGLAPELLMGELPPPSPQTGGLARLIVPEVENLLARSLTQPEVEQILAIEQAHLIAVEPARAAYAQDLAEAVGLAPEAVFMMLSERGP